MDNYLKQAHQDMEGFFADYSSICRANTIRTLEAFREERVSTDHFQPTSGYGFNDLGRDKLEMVLARIFGTEAALMRQQIVSGSHAIAIALQGNLLPGDELVTLGMPYDSLQSLIGIKGAIPGSLLESGISHRVLDIDLNNIDPAAIIAALSSQTKMLSIQRSPGYSWRPSLSVTEIGRVCQAVKAARPDVIIFVDNCYGEMVEELEPSHLGADLMAGSLNHNLGAGLTPTGGYIVGREDLVERAGYRLTVPGSGWEIGPSVLGNRLYYQALFMAPGMVAETLAGMVFIASLLQSLGFEVSPGPNQSRSDVIQCLKMNSPEPLVALCQGIQRYSPIESFVMPEAALLPGYDSEIIMASGGFVQGSTATLSADAPLREPYILYAQGGLNRHHTAYAITQAVQDMQKQGLI